MDLFINMMNDEEGLYPPEHTTTVSLAQEQTETVTAVTA